VQVKMWEGEAWDLGALDQLRDAARRYNPSSLVLLTTAQTSSERFAAGVDELTREISLYASVLYRNDVLRWLLVPGDRRSCV